MFPALRGLRGPAVLAWIIAGMLPGVFPPDRAKQVRAAQRADTCSRNLRDHGSSPRPGVRVSAFARKRNAGTMVTTMDCADDTPGLAGGENKHFRHPVRASGLRMNSLLG